MHFNLNRVAFESNLTKNPKMCLARPEICLDSYRGNEVSRDPDGSLIGRFSWPLERFSELVQADINIAASRVSYLFRESRASPEALGLALTDSPWYYDLAVNSHGDACGGIDEYAYSYGSPTGLFDCHRVWDVRQSSASHPPPRLPLHSPSPVCTAAGWERARQPSILRTIRWNERLSLDDAR